MSEQTEESQTPQSESPTISHTLPSETSDTVRKEVEGGNDEQPAPKRKRKSRWDTGSVSDVASASNTTQSQPAMTVDTTIAQQLIAQQVLKQQQVQTPAALAIPTPTPPPAHDCRIYVGSLNYDLKEADIKALFASFGTIRSFTMSHDNITGKSKGYCFVEYETAEMAEAALAMNQFQLAGRPIKVGRPLNAAPGATAPPPNPMAAMLNIPLSSTTSPAVGTAPATAQAFLNGLGAGAVQQP